MFETIDDTDCFEATTKIDMILTNTDVLYQTQYFSTYYFYNLKENVGYNYRGSCSYVGIAMMLSYYDTYWDDGIIDDNYDKNWTCIIDDEESPYYEFNILNVDQSPGIVSDREPTIDEKIRLELIEGKEFDNDLYYQFVLDHSGDYFHFDLIERMVTEDIYQARVMQGISPFGLGVDGRTQLIQDYLQSSGAKLTFETVTTNLENYIITNVTKGIPVMVALDLPNQKVGHVVVVYDYDANTGKLYAHLGDEPGLTHVDLSSLNYTRIKNATTFTPTGSHSHSDNYVCWDGSTYCSCYFPVHPSHKHEYEACEGAESTYHTYACGCKAENDLTFSHNFEYCNINDSGHQEVCKDCGYERPVLTHSFQYTGLGGTQHNARCKHCGYETVKYHHFECDGTENGVHYEKCVDCGYRISQFTEFEYTDKTSLQHNKTCGSCGYAETENHSLGYKNKSDAQHDYCCLDCGYVKQTYSHTYTYVSLTGNRHRKTCIICSASKVEMCRGMASVDGDSYCMTCGQKLSVIPELLAIDENGDVIPLVKKEEDYSCD